jgi:hypothetical protein
MSDENETAHRGEVLAPMVENMPFGTFQAAAERARREDVDAAVHAENMIAAELRRLFGCYARRITVDLAIDSMAELSLLSRENGAPCSLIVQLYTVRGSGDVLAFLRSLDDLLVFNRGTLDAFTTAWWFALGYSDPMHKPLVIERPFLVDTTHLDGASASPYGRASNEWLARVAEHARGEVPRPRLHVVDGDDGKEKG